jgi:hypothetical protein
VLQPTSADRPVGTQPNDPLRWQDWCPWLFKLQTGDVCAMQPFVRLSQQ